MAGCQLNKERVDLLSCPTAAASSFENTRGDIVGSLTYEKEESIPKILGKTINKK